MGPRFAMLLAALFAAPGGHAAGFPEFDAPALKQGRQVFLSTCEACHANPLSDAPQVKQPAAWSARLAKGQAVLYASALNGSTGQGGAEMPPRGGNAMLSDQEVKAAVDYMLKLINPKGEMK